MTQTTQRRRLRFKLRTLFVVTTACGLWLGWLVSNYNLVQSRRALWPSFNGGHSLFAAQLLPADPAKDVPLVRKLMGDFACGDLIYQPSDDPDGRQLRMARQLFPEANVWVWPNERDLPDGVRKLADWQAVGDHARNAQRP